MATNPFEKFRTKIAEGLFALNTKLFADGEKVSGDNPLPMKQYGSIGVDGSLIADSFSFVSDGEESVFETQEPIEIIWLEMGSTSPNMRLKLGSYRENGGITNWLLARPDIAGYNGITLDAIENYGSVFFDVVKNTPEDNKYKIGANKTIPMPNGGEVKVENPNNEEADVSITGYYRRLK